MNRLAGQIPCNRQCHSRYATFAGTVRSLANLAIIRSDRSHIDDDTTLAVFCLRLVVLHGFRTQSQHIEGANQVNSQDKLKGFQWHEIGRAHV